MKPTARRCVLRSAPGRILNLELLIARFVDDVLRTIRAASLEEVREACAPAAWSRRASAQRKGAPKGRQSRRVPVPPRKEALELAERVPTPEPHAAPEPEPPAFAEITDPVGLLAAAPVPEDAPTSPTGVAEDVAEERPPSTERPAPEATVALREGESLVRAGGAGVVIRRAKRA
jgi:hypothetical protein